MEYENNEPTISQREVERKYKKLLEDVSTKEYYTKIDLTNRVNVYSCKCGNKFKTIDKDAGVTPMFKNCILCGTTAVSSMYKDIAPELKPVAEWYRPSLKECLKMRKNEPLLDHILAGGLEFRLITPTNNK